ncbi:hypothetical protein D3874_21305 [Oleomonas cavernae]|uniref:Uncharacterized protein n=1 Tax=Oleomonas cavernae TaxID=2320859 RepID=A0A418WGP3_9PROT|nr:hypothetical protein [Oleomonas cavernae]RJF89197.1 hypothetical protein D3874_21305 [Oleomonas cavernae]
MSMINQAPLPRPVTLERLQWQPKSMRLTPASAYRDPEFLINLKGYIEALLPFDGPPLRLRREAHEATARRWRPAAPRSSHPAATPCSTTSALRWAMRQGRRHASVSGCW